MFFMHRKKIYFFLREKKSSLKFKQFMYLFELRLSFFKEKNVILYRFYCYYPV